MRIIAGKYKSRIIKTVKNYNTRPVLDRVKESIFNILVHKYNIEGSAVLDLFAGSGSFGLEAISRGAGSAAFVEKETPMFKILSENIVSLECGNICSAFKKDVGRFLKENNEKFDLIFFDPPFKMSEAIDLISEIYEQHILKKNGYLIFRTNKEYEQDIFKFKIEDKRKIGINIIYFLR